MRKNMGKWINAGYLLSDEIVGLVHNLMADYQNGDFAVFRSRLLELVNGQTKIKNSLNETVPYFHELQEDIGELKDSYEQLVIAYQEDKYPSIILSEDELARLAETIIQRFDESVKNDSLEGVTAKIKELTEKKEPVPVRKETPNYSQKINQLLTAVNNIQQQNREMAEKLEELQKQKEAELVPDENEASRMQEDNKSLLQALNNYKTAFMALKNERNDLVLQLEKLKKENFLRIRRKELQDSLLEQKDNEIAKLEKELAKYKNQAVNKNESLPSGRTERSTNSNTAQGNQPSPATGNLSAINRMHKTAMPGTAGKNNAAEKTNIIHSPEKPNETNTPRPEEVPKTVPKAPAASSIDQKTAADAAEKETSVPAGKKESVSSTDSSTEKNTSRPAAKTKASRPAAKAEPSWPPKEAEKTPEKSPGSTGIERAKKR